jgi:hypothetical protein
VTAGDGAATFASEPEVRNAAHGGEVRIWTEWK